MDKTSPEDNAHPAAGSHGVWPGLFVRRDGRLEEAPPQDQELARSYPSHPSKGDIQSGERLTLMTRKLRYHVAEEIRILHVHEVVEPGRQLGVMGPKPVTGEYLDGALTLSSSQTIQDDRPYQGATILSPAIDYNYEITTYSFDRPGGHSFDWRIGELRSNVLRIEIVADSGATVEKGR